MHGAHGNQPGYNAAMTIFLSLHTCNLSTRSRTGTNPFTGATEKFPVDHGLTEAEREQVRDALAQMGAVDADSEGYRKIECADGGEFNVGTAGIDNESPFVGCHIEIEALTRQVLNSMLKLARVGNMATCSSVEPGVASLTKQSSNQLIAERWPGAAVVNSPEELGKWLRERIVRG